MTTPAKDAVASCDYFALEGTIDAGSERYLKELAARVGQSKVRLDFSKVGRINSMGIALLLRCLKEIKESKRADITVEGLAPMHAMLFKMTGVFLMAGQVAAEGKGAQ